MKAFACTSGQRFETTTRTYCAYADALPWDAAEHRCVENGGHLATLDSPAAAQALRSVLGSPAAIPRALWIGLELKKTGTKKEWRWGNGAPVTAPAWSAGEPNDFYGDGTEACAEWLVFDAKWNDTRCGLRLPALCELRKNTSACTGTSVLEGKYCIEPLSRTHAEAKKQCASQGGALAGPFDEAEQEALKRALAARFAATRFWIGLNDLAEEGHWTWSSGAAFEHSSWRFGEPNDYSKEDCVEVYADEWSWNDFDCAAPRASVCESPPKKN